MPRKKKKAMWKLILSIALSSKIALLGAYYLGSRNPSFSRRISDSLFYDNVPIAEDSFPDPAGLEVKIELNKHGKKATYLVHKPSGKRIEIGYDLLPRSLDDIRDGLEKRIYSMEAQGSEQKIYEKLTAVTSRITEDSKNNLAQYGNYAKRIDEIAENQGKYTEQEICETVIGVCIDLQGVMENNFAQQDSYFNEVSGILGDDMYIPKKGYEPVISSFKESKKKLREDLTQNGKRIEEWTNILNKISKNQKL